MGDVPYRDPLAAAQARIEALEAELRAIRGGEGGIPAPPELAPLLAPDERLLWHARPEPPAAWPRPAGAALLGYLSAAGTLFGAVVLTLRGVPPRMWLGAAMLTLGIPLALLVRRFRRRARVAGARYALTDRRLIVARQGGRQIRALPLADIGTSLLELDGDGRGALHIRLGDGAALTLPGIRGAARAARLLEAARERARAGA